jgi:hypothetical protein
MEKYSVVKDKRKLYEYVIDLMGERLVVVYKRLEIFWSDECL